MYNRSSQGQKCGISAPGLMTVRKSDSDGQEGDGEAEMNM